MPATNISVSPAMQNRAHAVAMQDDGRHAVLSSIGLALILVGQPIAWFVRGQLTDGESPIFPAGVVLIGFLLLMADRPFRNPRLQVDPAILAIYVLLILVPIATMAGLTEPIELLTDWTYTLFAIAIMAMLAITPLAALRYLPLSVCLVGGLSSALPLYELATASALDAFVRLTLKGNVNTLVIGTVGGITILSGVLTLITGGARTVAMGVLVALAVMAGLAAVVLSNTRSVMLALIYSLPLLLFAIRPLARGTFVPAPVAVRRLQRIAFISLALGAAVAAPTVALTIFDRPTLEKVAAGFGDRFTGAFTVLSGDEFGAVDRSSQERVELIESTLEGLTIMGKGVNSQLLEYGNRRDRGVYPHFTYLQTFYDTGVIGALIFTLTNLAIPLALIVMRFTRKSVDPVTAFFATYYIYSHIDHATHGTPYFWYITLPVALVYVMIPRKVVSFSDFKFVEKSRRVRA